MTQHRLGAAENEPKDPAEHLAEIERALAQWHGFKTSLYWRLESERVRLLEAVKKGDQK